MNESRDTSSEGGSMRQAAFFIALIFGMAAAMLLSLVAAVFSAAWIWRHL